MFRFAHVIAAVIVAALVASVATFGSMALEAKAETTLAPAPLSQPAAPAKGPACLLQGWPHYDQSCQFDLRGPAGETRKIRVIALR